MGFYGNISNTAKTTFQFDRIYANKYDMDIGAQFGDGVYPGRFVLIDYNQATDENLYDIQKQLVDQSQKYWLYNGEMFLGSPPREKIGNTLFYKCPTELSPLGVESEGVSFNIGDIILVREGCRVSNLNSTGSKYVKITELKSDGSAKLDHTYNNTSYLKWLDEYITAKVEEECIDLKITDEKEIKKRINEAILASYRLVDNPTAEYEPGVLFIKK